MTRAKTQNPMKAGKKRLATPPQLTPIDDADVDAAFAGIRMDSEHAMASPPADVHVDVNADAAAAAAAISDLSTDDVPVEVESGADFAPDLADLAEVKKADSPTRRARTQPAEAASEESQPLPKRGPPKPPPKKTDAPRAGTAKTDAPNPDAPKTAAPKIPSILSKVKAAETATNAPPAVARVSPSPPPSPVSPRASSSHSSPASPPPGSSPPSSGSPVSGSSPASPPSAPSSVESKPLLAPATGGASLGRIGVPAAKGKPPPPPRPGTRAETVGGTPVGGVPRPPAATIPEAPPTIVTPNPLAAIADMSPPNPPPLAPPPRAESIIELADRSSENELGAKQFPRSESAVMDAPAYVAPRRAKRATSERDYDYGDDEDAMTSADLAAKLREINQAPPRPSTEAPSESPRPGSYLEYAMRAGLPRKGGADTTTTPPARDSEMKIEPVPTKVLDAALRFDSEPKSEFDIQPVPTKILDAALRFDSESEVNATAPKPPAKAPLPAPRPELPKLALGDAPTPRSESEFDYSSLALDNDASGRIAEPRANSALERALRDSMSSIDVDVDVEDESGDFGEVIAPIRTMQLAERAPSVSEAQTFERAEVPRLQLAVYESAANLTSAMQAIDAAGHAMAVGGSGREGLEQIGMAIADGHIDVVLVGIPGGEVLVKAALSLAPWGPVVVAACNAKAGEAARQANAVGADLVTIRPHDGERLGPVLLAAARILEQRRDLMAAQQGREENLLSRLGSDAESDEVGGLLPFDAFQRALELELKRVRRYQYAMSVALFAMDVSSTQTPPVGIKGILRARAGNAVLHSIRDIDMATELDQDRFLVLLPYTDLSGATEVARRIIGAVGAIAPVVASGGEFAVRLVGAIAGAKPGQQLSFTKLIRDAQRALEAARRDGAELAVQP